MDQSHKPSSNSESGSAPEAVAIVPDEAIALVANTEISEAGRAREALDMQLRELQAELAIVQGRLLAIKQQARTVARDNIGWIDACAHEQLGAYPWLKLAGITLAAFTMGRFLHRLPIGLVAIAARPLLATANRGGRPWV